MKSGLDAESGGGPGVESTTPHGAGLLVVSGAADVIESAVPLVRPTPGRVVGDRLRAPRFLACLGVVCVAGAMVGCSSMWDSVRERQRLSSIGLSRDFVKRGEWTRAFESIERAQTRRQLGDFAPESVYLKATCLAALGRDEEALAHWRMLHDQYGDTRWAERIPSEIRPLLGETPALRARAAPIAFEMPKPRYSRGAQRASVAGPVWVEYRLDADGQPTELRVIQSAHPLLAAYALEAVASGRWRASAGTAVELPRRALSPFRFESLWMDEAEEEPLTGSVEPWPPPPDEDEDPDEEDGDGFGIEWFPQG